MNPRLINRFFRLLAKEFNRPATLILTGAAAGSLWGHVRPSRDLDFGVEIVGNDSRAWELFQQAITRTIRQTGIDVNYAEDIDRWSSITLLDYRRHTRLHRRYGTLAVRLLDPAYWSIGKLARYYELDVQDVVIVLKRRHVPLPRLMRILGKALRERPHSPALFQFRMQVEHFLRTHGRSIWGRPFDPDAAIRQSHRTAGIRPPLPRHP